MIPPCVRLASFSAILTVALAATVPQSVATLVVEDFTYASGALLSDAQGSGWNGGWGASSGAGSNSSRIIVDSTNNLTSTIGGYNIAQTGTGLAYGNFNAFRGINRNIDVNLTGTVWFSLLVRNGESDDHAGIEFNNHADAPFSLTDYNPGAFHAEVFGTDLEVRYNGATFTGLASLPLGQTHLLLGRIVFTAGNDTLDLWADPASVSNLGPALFSQSTADMGTDLFLAGAFSYGNADLNGSPGVGHGKLDALRLSDGGGSPAAGLQDVVGIPEPTCGAIAAMGLFGLAARRQRRRA